MIRIIALISMVIDHTGLLIFPQNEYFRIIGRVAFPVYLYMCALGYKNTHCKRRYAMKMLLFTLGSMIPCLIAFDNPVNIGVTYLCVIGECFGSDLIRKDRIGYKASGLILIGTIYFVCLLLGSRFPYYWYGLVIGLLYYMRHSKNQYVISFAIIAVTYLYVITRPEAMMQMLAIPVFIILPYMKKEWIYGKIRLKYFFYLFYPVHIIILYVISMKL